MIGVSNITEDKYGEYSHGIFYIYVSISILTSIIINYIIMQNYEFEYYPILIWLIIFILYFFIFKKYILRNIKKIIYTFKRNKRWPKKIILLNSIVWSFPILLGLIIQTNFIYYVSMSIGFGNIVTYLIFLKYNKTDNREQLIVGFIVLLSTFFTAIISLNSLNLDVIIRIIIGISYGIGGIYSLLQKFQF